jgi:hypothetical protein
MKNEKIWCKYMNERARIKQRGEAEKREKSVLRDVIMNNDDISFAHILPRSLHWNQTLLWSEYGDESVW